MLYEINERVIQLERAGKKIIRFNTGDPEQPTDPKFISAALAAMKKGKTKYASAAGEVELRARLAEMHGVRPENIVITPGSKWAVFAAMWLLLKNGGNVVLPSPYWTSYGLIAKEINAEARFLKTGLEQDWQPDVDALAGLIDEKTRLIILNSPNNPTSKIMDKKIFSSLLEIAAAKKIPVLSDECYAEISFKRSPSALDFDSGLEKNIVINSFSKTYAMSGWRIGYAILNKGLAAQFMRLNQMTITNVPVFIQEAALAALEKRSASAKKMRALYKRRANLAVRALSKTRLKFARPDAPFYLFPRCGIDSEKLALELIGRGVAITPGAAFGDYRNFFRLTLTLPDAEIKTGLRIIADRFK